jgi:hypothetical protein
MGLRLLPGTPNIHGLIPGAPSLTHIQDVLQAVFPGGKLEEGEPGTLYPIKEVFSIGQLLHVQFQVIRNTDGDTGYQVALSDARYHPWGVFDLLTEEDLIGWVSSFWTDLEKDCFKSILAMDPRAVPMLYPAFRAPWDTLNKMGSKGIPARLARQANLPFRVTHEGKNTEIVLNVRDGYTKATINLGASKQFWNIDFSCDFPTGVPEYPRVQKDFRHKTWTPFRSSREHEIKEMLAQYYFEVLAYVLEGKYRYPVEIHAIGKEIRLVSPSHK